MQRGWPGGFGINIKFASQLTEILGKWRRKKKNCPNIRGMIFIKSGLRAEL